MRLATITFVPPTIGALLWLLVPSTFVGLSLYGLGAQIDSGEIDNDPELLRHLLFWPFSLGLAFRFASEFGLSANRFPQKLMMVLVFFFPIALVLAFVVGLLGR